MYLALSRVTSLASLHEVVEIPLGLKGMMGTKNINKVPVDMLIDAQNVTYLDGTIRKGEGATPVGSAITGTPILVGGHYWDHDGNTGRLVVLGDDGKLYKDDLTWAFGTTLKSGMTVSADTCPIFVEGGAETAAANRKLFVFSGSDQVQVLAADGATTADIATPPSDWSATYPTVGCNHQLRVWGAGNSNHPHRVYWSSYRDHEDFTGEGSGSMTVFPGEGEGIIGLASYMGMLVVFKTPKGIYLIDTRSVDIYQWYQARINANTGPAWIRGWDYTPNDIIFIDRVGDIRALTRTRQDADVGSLSISDAVEFQPWIIENVSLAQYKRWRCRYYAYRREFHVGVTKSGSTVPDLRIVIDVQIPNLMRWRYNDKDTFTDLFTVEESSIPKLYSGDNGGLVWKLDEETRNKNSAAYASTFQTPHLDLSHVDPVYATRRKNAHFLEIVHEPKGTYTLDVDVYWDGSLHETVSFDLGTGGATLGTFILGTDKLGSYSVLNAKKRLTGGGRRVSFVGKNNRTNEDFSIARMFFHYTLADERLI